MGVAGSAQWGSLPPGPRWPQAAQRAAWLLRPLELVEHLRDRFGTPFTLRFPASPPIVTFDDPAANEDLERR